MANLNLETSLARLIRWGLYLAFFIPFVFWRTLMFPFITPKVFGFHILIEIIFGAWLLYLLLRRERPSLTRVSLAVLALLAVLLLTAATGINFHRSFWSTQERGIGVFSLLHFGAFFAVLADFLRRGFVRLETYLKVAFFAAAAVAAGAVFQVYYPKFFIADGSARAGSFLGNPTYLAGYALFYVFLGLWFALRSSSGAMRWVFTGLAALQVIIIVLFTQTRGAILGLGAGLLFLLAALAFSKNNDFSGTIKKWARILLAALAVFALVFLLTLKSPFWAGIPGVSRIASLGGGWGDVAPRLMAWKIAWRSFLERPLWGWGFENFKYAFDFHFNPSLFRFGFGETYWDKPHNIFLEYLVVGGILGIAALLVLFGVAFRALYRLPYGIFFVAALGAHLVSDIFVFDTFGTYLMFFIFLAVADSAADGGLNFSGGRETQAKGFLPDTPGAPGAHRRGGVRIYHPALRAVLFGLVAIFTAFLVSLNIAIFYTNNRHFWGANYFVNGFVEEGLNSFRQALDFPFNPYVNATRRDFGSLVTQMYTQKKMPEPEKNLPWAVREVDKAIGKDPNNYYLYLTLADMTVNFYELNPGQLLAIGRAAIDKAIQLSNRQQNYYVQAKLHLIKNEDKEAVAAMEKAVALDPQIGGPHFYYALTLFEAGDTEKGFEELKIAEELGRLPETAEEARTVANYYGDAGKWEQAVFWYKVAITKDPSDSEARLKLGLVYYMSGRRELAKEEISKVMRKTDLKQSPAYELLLPILRDLGLEP